MLARLLPKCSDHRSQTIPSQPPPADSSPPLPSIAAPGLRSHDVTRRRGAHLDLGPCRGPTSSTNCDCRNACTARAAASNTRPRALGRTTCTRNRQLHDNAPEPYEERVDSRRSAVCTNVDSAAGPARTGSGVQAGNMGPGNSKSSRPPTFSETAALAAVLFCVDGPGGWLHAHRRGIPRHAVPAQCCE